MYNKILGSKYDAKLTTTEIAKLIRKELKAKHPAIKFSVRKRGHSSVDIEILTAPFMVTSPEYMRTEITVGVAKPWGMARFTKSAAALLASVEAIAGAYNYDRSEIESDYFDVNFYLSVTFSQDLTAPEWEDARALALADSLANAA